MKIQITQRELKVLVKHLSKECVSPTLCQLHDKLKDYLEAEQVKSLQAKALRTIHEAAATKRALEHALKL